VTLALRLLAEVGRPGAASTEIVPDTCQIERPDTDARGHSTDLCQDDDLHERWSGKAQSQPSKLLIPVLPGT
jgi:hypothetical protein